MKHLKIGFSLTIVLILIIWAAQSKSQHSHQFKGKCYICHVGLKNPSILTHDINFLCLSCHINNSKRSHPSNFIPHQQIPSQFPLFKKKMVCITCHFPHQQFGKDIEQMVPRSQEVIGRKDNRHFEISDIENSTPKPGPFLLRAEEAGKIFCYKCHKQNFISAPVDSHAISYQKAHTPILEYQKSQSIDDQSKDCLSCHDGTISSNSDIQFQQLNWQHTQNIGLSHPISIDYEEIYLKKPRLYHPPAHLDPRIILINGKIGCQTCHNHFSKHKKHLVMDNFRSRLCLSCHNL